MKKQLVILSGKGGTGKTTIAAAFSKLAQNSVIADCDVDAADLFILLKPEIKDEVKFYGGKKASINKDICNQCGICNNFCRFDAIKNFKVDELLCEGCGFCQKICPQNAIDFQPVISGSYFNCKVDTSKNFLFARLMPGEGNSGKLVTELKKNSAEYFLQNGKEWFIVDGPPGIGCPVNASITAADLILLITEPTLSGLHDLERIIKLIKLFNISVRVVVNKFDINEEMTSKIEDYLKAEKIELAGKIPFDETVVRSLQQEKSIVEFPASKASIEITTIWNSLQN